MNDLVNLRTFVAAATAGSFAAAARRLDVSPAMVGRRIQALEAARGIKLIARTTRSQRLTELGSDFLLAAQRVLDEVEALDDLSGVEPAAVGGRMRITAPTTLGIRRLVPVVASLSTQHPALSIELYLGDRSVDLVGEGFDLAVRIGELRPSSLIARRVGAYGFVCCASPGYLAQHGQPATPQDLTRLACVLNLNLVPRGAWPFMDAHGTAFSVDVSGGVGIDNGEGLRIAALAGAGIIYCPAQLVEDDLATGCLVEVLAGWRKLTLPVHTLHPSRQFVPRRIGFVVEAIAQALKRDTL